jgi:hypothetical protein
MVVSTMCCFRDAMSGMGLNINMRGMVCLLSGRGVITVLIRAITQHGIRWVETNWSNCKTLDQQGGAGMTQALNNLSHPLWFTLNQQVGGWSQDLVLWARADAMQSDTGPSAGE